MKTVSLSVRFPAEQHARIQKAVDGVLIKSINQLVVIAVERMLKNSDNTYTYNTLDPKPPVASTNVDTPNPPTASTPKKKKKQTSSKHSYSKEFLAFWELYPRKVERRSAYEAWKKELKNTTVEDIMKGLESWIVGGKFAKERQYIVYPHRWLKKGCYEVEPVSAPAPAVVPPEFRPSELSWFLEGESAEVKLEACDLIKDVVGARSYNEWIATTRWVKQGNTVWIVCPDQAHAQWLEDDGYLDAVAGAMTTLGHDYTCQGVGLQRAFDLGVNEEV